MFPEASQFDGKPATPVFRLEGALEGGQGAIRGAIRDLRNDISDRLHREANLACQPKDLILSGGSGYRLTEKLSVQDETDARAESDEGHGQQNRRPGDPEDDGHVPKNDVPKNDVPKNPTDESVVRRAWIVQQLEAGVELRSPMVKEQFGCSLRTAKRDLEYLKDDGLIEFIGPKKTGYYRLASPPKPAP